LKNLFVFFLTWRKKKEKFKTFSLPSKTQKRKKSQKKNFSYFHQIKLNTKKKNW